ncbi:hypothetical protein SAMN05216352_1056 [Alteribacillus bidgolensis]|uniref:Uncharacterized protein n=1 Tax=Alteribacillus bidgolensis TaxID=930129 RepID=A0A1G8I2A6_9BACI|nr:hypothetical protein SAMN05216352_1056 [Alteribacillus bidgolensis]
MLYKKSVLLRTFLWQLLDRLHLAGQIREGHIDLVQINTEENEYDQTSNKKLFE